MGQGIGSTKQAASATDADNPSTPLSLPNGHGHSTSETVPPQQKSVQSSDFILHGIDYLPDFEKRRERRRRKSAVPRFLRIDTALWSSSYLRFLGRVGRSSPEPESSEKSDSGEPDATPQKANTKGVVSFDDGFSLSDAVATPDCLTEIVSDEWMSYTSYPFENLVMSGGGSKGYAYIGALKALEDCGVLGKVKRIAGSSAGAICAGLLAVGCSPQDIADVFKCDIKWLFHDQPCECCCCLPRLCNKYGIHPARRFYRIYGEHIARKVSDPDITFKQVFDRLGCELCIVVTNLSRMCSEYCCPEKTPDLPIRDAVRMSMSFPVVFRAVRRNISGRECLYADGGILDQYPISFFDASEFELNHNVPRADSPTESSGDAVNWKTLGLYLVSEKAMDYRIWQTLFGKEIPSKPTYLPNTKLARARLHRELSNRKRENKQFSKKEYMEELKANDAVELWDHYQVLNKSHVDITNFGEYFITAIETLLVAQRKMHVKPTDVVRTVAINCGYIGTSDYVIEPGDREFMIRQGYECTRRYLSQLASAQSVNINGFPRNGSSVPVTENHFTDSLGNPVMLRCDNNIKRAPGGHGTIALPGGHASVGDMTPASGRVDSPVGNRSNSHGCLTAEAEDGCQRNVTGEDVMLHSALDASHSTIWQQDCSSFCNKVPDSVLNSSCHDALEVQCNGCLLETQV